MNVLQDRGDELERQERELKVTRDELIRTGAVAQRVAASETRGGNKDEGVVPVAMHLEEVREVAPSPNATVGSALPCCCFCCLHRCCT